MNLQQTDVTGCRIVGAITKELGHSGPKHHGIILGKSWIDGEIYIAELMTHGYQVCTFSNFRNRYSENGNIIVEPNDGNIENMQVAQRAIQELKNNSKESYDLITNNCECFVNRVIHGKSHSTQVVNTALGVLALAGLVYVIKNSK